MDVKTCASYNQNSTYLTCKSGSQRAPYQCSTIISQDCKHRTVTREDHAKRRTESDELNVGEDVRATSHHITHNIRILTFLNGHIKQSFFHLIKVTNNHS